MNRFQPALLYTMLYTNTMRACIHCLQLGGGESEAGWHSRLFGASRTPGDPSAIVNDVKSKTKRGSVNAF